MTYILALDQGTSSSRALVYDAAGAVVGSAQQSIDSTYPQDGWVEQDPAMIWSSILAVGRQAIADANIARSARHRAPCTTPSSGRIAVVRPIATPWPSSAIQRAKPMVAVLQS
jgi:hypothetical protein